MSLKIHLLRDNSTVKSWCGMTGDFLPKAKEAFLRVLPAMRCARCGMLRDLAEAKAKMKALHKRQKPVRYVF